MTNTVRVTILTSSAFLLPFIVVMTMHWEQVQDYFTIDPRTVKGHVLYFTAPT